MQSKGLSMAGQAGGGRGEDGTFRAVADALLLIVLVVAEHHLGASARRRYSEQMVSKARF
jgi:hypothetical protein